MTLYELNVQMQTILEMAEDGELDPQLIADTLEGVEGEIEIKLDSYGIVMNELQMDVAKIDLEIKRLTENKKQINNNIDRMKAAVMNTMTLMGTRKVKGDNFTWSIQKNGGKAPLIIDESVPAISLPEEYQLWDVRPNKEVIRQDLEAGAILPYARLGERGESLRLK